MRQALVTGITGQDGSYLAELLLGKGYEVWGLVRRTSVDNLGRIRHLAGQVKFVEGDVTSAAALAHALRESKPDEVYHLAAQSHVGTSFHVPDVTFAVTGGGTVDLLEAVRQQRGGRTRVYHAATSELFGDSPPPQDESTPMSPLSPYAVAKLAGYWWVKCYRRAYGVHASNGVLFNHECVTAETPIVVRRRGMVDIMPIEEIVTHREDPRSGKKYMTDTSNSGLEVWDRDKWTAVTCATATWADARAVTRVRGRGAIFTATDDHVAFLDDVVERQVGAIRENDQLTLCHVPDESPAQTTLTEDEAWLLGAIVADGYVADGHGRITKNDETFRVAVAQVWARVTGGYTTFSKSRSGFTGDDVEVVTLNGASSYLKMIRSQVYTERALKRVPTRVLNAGRTEQLAFLRGYNAGDGLKAGHEKYEFKSWKTNSPTLAAGLWWVASAVLRQRMILWTEDRDDITYYAINLNTPNETGKGAHLRKSVEEVVGIDKSKYTGWLFDLATESSTFHAGIGSGWIHNSPRRTETFVTRKVTLAAARIKRGLQRELRLGNLNARRDWGHARDYVEAMWLMLQQDEPDDYVVATGETRSVRDFVEAAFAWHGLDWRDHVVVDPDLYRPAEVEALCGDASKVARLGWSPRTTFRQLVEEMAAADDALVAREVR